MQQTQARTEPAQAASWCVCCKDRVSLEAMPEVHFIGELESADGFGGANVFAKWRIDAHGPHWRVVDGATAGRTWLAERRGDEAATWNEPIGCSFSTSHVSGWPSLLIQVYTVDSFDRVDLGGYGVVRLPLSPGLHQRRVVISRPRGSLLSYVASLFIGGYPRYTHPEVLYSSAPRFGHRTESVGAALLSLHVILKGFDEQTLPHVRMGEDAVPQMERAAAFGRVYSDETYAAEQSELAAQLSVCGRCPTAVQSKAAAAAQEEKYEEKAPSDTRGVSLADAVRSAVAQEIEEIDRQTQTNIAAAASSTGADSSISAVHGESTGLLGTR
jgi:hypothetical protein